MATQCPACGAELVLAVRQLDRAAMGKAAAARWAKRPPEPPPIDFDLLDRPVCLKCGHPEGCAEREGCRCLHRYGTEG